MFSVANFPTKLVVEYFPQTLVHQFTYIAKIGMMPHNQLLQQGPLLWHPPFVLTRNINLQYSFSVQHSRGQNHSVNKCSCANIAPAI